MIACPELAEGRLPVASIRAHMAGICGSGMQSLAAVLLGRGWQITGSDLVPQGAGWLAAAGVEVQSQAADNVSPDVDLLIYSEAIGSATPARTTPGGAKPAFRN